MRKSILTFAAAVAVFAAAPAFAGTDKIGPKIAACVHDGAFLNLDGKKVHLRIGDDFRVVRHDAYNQYGVQWKKRIQRDKRWAHAEKVAHDCIGAAMVGKVANAKK